MPPSKKYTGTCKLASDTQGIHRHINWHGSSHLAQKSTTCTPNTQMQPTETEKSGTTLLPGTRKEGNCTSILQYSRCFSSPQDQPLRFSEIHHPTKTTSWHCMSALIFVHAISLFSTYLPFHYKSSLKHLLLIKKSIQSMQT